MSRTLNPRTPIWFVLAAGVGLLAATQPPAITFAAIALAAFALLGMITPLSALAVLLILAPMRTLIETEAPRALPLDIGQLTLLALVGFWLIHSIVKRRTLPRPGWSPVYIPIIIFLIVTGITAFSALSMGAWLTEWLKWLSVLLLVALCLDLGAWEWMVFALVLAGVANALVGIYQFFGGSGALVLLVAGRFFRAFGTFGQPNPFGGFMGLLAPIALMAAVGHGVRLWHARRARQPVSPSGYIVPIFYLLATGLLIIGVIFSWSRGSWLGFAASIAAMLLALPRKWWYGVIPVLAGALLIIALWLTGRLPASVISRVESVTNEITAFNDVRGVDITPDNYANVERLAHWQAAINMAQANPWLGVGFGNYENAYSQYDLLNWPLAQGHAHNYYLNVFAEAGIIGLVAYVTLWVSVMIITWRARRHPDPLARFMVVGLFGTWTYLAVHSLTDNLYVNNLFLHLGVMLGILAVLHRIEIHCVRME
ncbi:MAG: O-antigen ligase family protein [Chloroflexota bacterium]